MHGGLVGSGAAVFLEGTRRFDLMLLSEPALERDDLIDPETDSVSSLFARSAGIGPKLGPLLRLLFCC